MQGYFLAAVIAVLCIAVFAVQNSQEISLRFISWDLPPVPLVLLILFSAATGALATLVFCLARYLRLTGQVRELQGKVKSLEKKLAAGDQNSPGKAKT